MTVVARNTVMNKLPFVHNTYLTGNKVNRVIIALHGFTGNEHSMKPVAIGTRLKNVKWYFPRAPYALDRESEFSWFTGSIEKGWDCSESFKLIKTLIEYIEREEPVSSDNIFMVGFSQGGCLAVEAGLRTRVTLGGIVSIAGFIRHVSRLKHEVSPESILTPVLLLHGIRDTIVDIDSSRKSRNLLLELGVNATLEEYDASHKIPIMAYEFVRTFVEMEK